MFSHLLDLQTGTSASLVQLGCKMATKGSDWIAMTTMDSSNRYMLHVDWRWP